jgi:DeoR/GlpR family transcriptional regulator of sugar metabolism
MKSATPGKRFYAELRGFMLPQERHQAIVDQLVKHKKVLTEELSRALDVSADTIRRDLIHLEDTGTLVRVHGGAVAVELHTPFQPRKVYAQREKIQIAKKAITLIKDGMVLLMGGGTVMLEVARLLPENLKGTLFTVSPLVALEATQRSTVEVILIAGKLSRHSYICTGGSVTTQLSTIKADLCMMGTNGFSVKHGITDNDWEVVQVKKTMIAQAEHTALLSISEKKDIVNKLQVCPLSSIHYLITERNPGEPMFTEYYGHCKVM